MSTAVVLWQPRPEPIDPHEVARIEARDAAAAAKLAQAEHRRKHAEVQVVGLELVLSQFRKWQALSEDPDFAKAIGPIEPALVLKIAEFVTKEFRLNSGQSTENIAVAMSPSIDFSRLTQEERNAWRELAMKGGGTGD